MVRAAVIVPVAPYEPKEILISSVRHLLALDYRNFEVKILYIVDKKHEHEHEHDEDGQVKILRDLGVDVLERRDSRGRKAGAINDALEYLSGFKPEYIAIFDIDSQPGKKFLVESLVALESNKNAYIASSRRYIINPVNLVSETIEAEYYLINFLLRKSGFKQFNGPIGLLKSEFLYRYKLNEDAVAEDADFATRMHAKGYTAILVLVDGTELYEQSPVSWMDLLNQRKRWYYGGLQLWKYWKEVKNSGNRNFIVSWLMALTVTYAPILSAPVLIFAPFLLLYKFKKVNKISLTAGFIIYLVLLQYAAVAAVWHLVRGKRVEWKSIKRV